MLRLSLSYHTHNSQAQSLSGFPVVKGQSAGNFARVLHVTCDEKQSEARRRVEAGSVAAWTYWTRTSPVLLNKVVSTLQRLNCLRRMSETWTVVAQEVWSACQPLG
jgi:hypothetical protein